ncbi:MAG TPA: zinc-binding dehydrogenase [Nitrospirota bacterium]|nr:zinc-binding dehydrogenase [Nitrospirota bacterium]
MKSAILISPGVLEISSKAPIPVPGPGEVVVKVKAALTCGTDIKAYLRGHPKIPLPSPLGHEFAGDVHSAGEGVEGFTPGTPVMAVHSAPCEECAFCRMGKENLCVSVMDEKVLGAYAEYIKLPARVVQRNLFVKPEGLSYAEAAMLEPLSCVVHGMRMLDYGETKNVLILGAGPIGLLHLMLHKRMGLKVLVAGRRDERLSMARSLGADAVFDTKLDDIAWGVTEATDGLGADLVIEATGSKELWEASPSFVRKGGTVLLFGGTPSGTKACFDAGRLHYDEITLAGAFHFSPDDVREAYSLLTGGKLDVKLLISGEYALDSLQAAFDELIAGRGIKYVIAP